jgi:hypothetical protein
LVAEVPQTLAKNLHDQDVVRIDNVLSEQVADELKVYVHSLRATAEVEVATGKAPQKQRFLDLPRTARSSTSPSIIGILSLSKQ